MDAFIFNSRITLEIQESGIHFVVTNSFFHNAMDQSITKLVRLSENLIFQCLANLRIHTSRKQGRLSKNEFYSTRRLRHKGPRGAGLAIRFDIKKLQNEKNGIEISCNIRRANLADVEPKPLANLQGCSENYRTRTLV